MAAGNIPVWITGAGGLIGNYLVQSALQQAPDFQVIGLKRGDLDLTNFAAVEDKFLQQQPQLILHCAAISKSPQAQADPAFARKINVEVTKNLADLASDIPFFFFSSDLVFDGRTGNYDETSAVNPLNVYAETKVTA